MSPERKPGQGTGGRLPRRRFLAQVGAGVAGTMFGSHVTAGRQAGPATDTVHDVAVVGAGIAGLVCAEQLRRSNVDVVVLEARDRVGGRTLNQTIRDRRGRSYVVEAGGQWIGPGQTAVAELLEELGLETFPTWTDGRSVALVGGERLLLDSGNVPSGAAADELDRLAQTVPLDAPWDAEDAAELDQRTFASWLHEHCESEEELFDFEVAAAATFGASTARLSLLYTLFYIHSAGSLRALEAFEGGAQQDRIVGGSQTISQRLAERLGGRVRTSQPVRRIRHGLGDVVELVTDRGLVRARQVVLALSPALLTRLDFDPMLPEERRELQNRWPTYGGGIKGHVVFAKPFWRDQGLNGMVLADAGPIGFAMDNVPHPEESRGRRRSKGPGAVLFFADDAATLGASLEERRERARSVLATALGEPDAEAIDYVEHDWSNDPWTAGCVSPLAPGLLTETGRSLRAQVGRLHFAGTETAEIWCGYMDGAVRSGRAVASRLIDELAG